MKKLIYLLILALGIVACQSDEKTKISNTDLIGTWDWTNTDGGIAYHIHETPETTGKTIRLILMRNYQYSITENGNEISNGTYELTMKRSIYTQEEERFIKYSDIENQYQNVILTGIIEVLENKTLTISDNNHDGLGSLFQKIK